MAGTTTSTSPSSTEPAKAPAPEKVLRYIGSRADYSGSMKGSHRNVTKTQLVEAGISDPFTNSAQDVVEWSPSNGYSVPKSVFTDAAYARLLKEDDLEEAEASAE